MLIATAENRERMLRVVKYVDFVDVYGIDSEFVRANLGAGIGPPDPGISPLLAYRRSFMLAAFLCTLGNVAAIHSPLNSIEIKGDSFLSHLYIRGMIWQV
jgi:hypothetical protein